MYIIKIYDKRGFKGYFIEDHFTEYNQKNKVRKYYPVKDEAKLYRTLVAAESDLEEIRNIRPSYRFVIERLDVTEEFE